MHDKKGPILNEFVIKVLPENPIVEFLPRNRSCS